MIKRLQADLLNATRLWRTFRSQALLSALGVVVGVAGLVILVAVGGGAKRELDAALGSLGAGAVLIRSDADATGTRPVEQRFVDRALTLLGSQIDASARVQSTTVHATTAQGETGDFRRLATEGSYREIFRLRLYAGRFITAHDIREAQRVCVLTWEAARRLFPNGQVLGQQLRIDGDWHTVVGWLQPSGSQLPELNALNLADINLRIYTPLQVRTVVTRTPLDEVVLKFRSEARMSSAIELLQRMLAHNEESAELIIPIELLRQQQATQSMFQLFLLAVAGLMLVVGGVGIMNTMILNVVSRRPEIGLRIAVGATQRDIVQQFVCEALVLAAAAGAAGILVGYVVVALIGWGTDWSMAFDASAAVLGFTVAVTVGGVFGGYPALLAASVSPIESLRRAA